MEVFLLHFSSSILIFSVKFFYFIFFYILWIIFRMYLKLCYLELSLYRSKDVRELSWMSHGVMPSNFYWISFHFGFLWYSSFVIDFPRFYKWYFRQMKILLLRYSQNNYQIWLHKLNLMCEELFYQIINISAVN